MFLTQRFCLSPAFINSSALLMSLMVLRLAHLDQNTFWPCLIIWIWTNSGSHCKCFMLFIAIVPYKMVMDHSFSCPYSYVTGASSMIFII